MVLVTSQNMSNRPLVSLKPGSWRRVDLQRFYLAFVPNHFDFFFRFPSRFQKTDIFPVQSIQIIYCFLGQLLNFDHLVTRICSSLGYSKTTQICNDLEDPMKNKVQLMVVCSCQKNILLNDGFAWILC